MSKPKTPAKPAPKTAAADLIAVNLRLARGLVEAVDEVVDRRKADSPYESITRTDLVREALAKVVTDARTGAKAWQKGGKLKVPTDAPRDVINEAAYQVIERFSPTDTLKVALALVVSATHAATIVKEGALPEALNQAGGATCTSIDNYRQQLAAYLGGAKGEAP